jgi:salicylate hydroxylase
MHGNTFWTMKRLTSIIVGRGSSSSWFGPATCNGGNNVVRAFGVNVSPTSSDASSQRPSLAIIGGGIGGLTSACALLRKENLSSRVTVYDQASHFVPTAGAGFGLSPNGQVCLASIGITDYQSTMLHPFNTIARLDRTGTAIVQQSDVLEQIRNRYGFGLAGCLRADLVDLLVRSLQEQQQQEQHHDGETSAIRYSHKLIRIQQVADKVELDFENGHTDLVDLVIGADGIHSFVAKAMDIDHTDPLYSGANIFYGIMDEWDDDVPWQTPVLQGGLVNTILQGPGTGEFIAFRAGGGPSSKLVWVTTYVSSKPPTNNEEWDVAKQRSELDDVLRQYPSTHPIHELASRTDPGRMLHFGLFHRRHKSTWYRDRVVLLGDSCHATLPYVGQGANQAIEDAIVLADCLSKHMSCPSSSSTSGHVTAFQEYYDRRFNRTKRVVNMANMMDKLYHSRNWFVQRSVDFLLSQFLKGGFIFKQIEKEIVDECPVKDYAKYRR